MVHITKESVEAFAEFSKDDKKFAGYYFYRGKPMSKWMLFRFRFAFWRMKTFRLFRKPIDDAGTQPR